MSERPTATESTPGEITITRVFDAPRELVWKVWTEPEHLKQWWSPKGFTAPVAQIDLRVGGKYLASMRSADGTEIWSTGVYREVVPPERLVVTDNFADEHGNVVPASHYGFEGEWPAEAQIEITFAEEAGKTRMTLRHFGLPASELEGANAGWNEFFDKLDEYLAKIK
jgi:uncharacterized protein YndB with AHSA1/START domain